MSEAQDAVVSREVTTCAEQDIQLEEAYGRATVALTRARSLCIIMGPLDMKGLLGAATGSLMCGAGHVFKSQANFYLHDVSLGNSPPDAEFGQLLDRSNCLSSQRLHHL